MYYNILYIIIYKYIYIIDISIYKYIYTYILIIINSLKTFWRYFEKLIEKEFTQSENKTFYLLLKVN